MRVVLRDAALDYPRRKSVHSCVYVRKFVVKIFAISSLLLTVGVGEVASQQRKSIPPSDKNNPLQELIPGYYFNSLSRRARQDDDFDNVGYVTWVTKGEKLWEQIDGELRKSCALCHEKASSKMRGKAVTYPKYDPLARKVITLEQRINLCRQNNMKAPLWSQVSQGSQELLAMTAYIRAQSHRMPVNVSISGPAATTFELGKKIYNTPSGQLGMTCGQCHNEHYGDFMRGTVISQGHPTAFPAWRDKSHEFQFLSSRINDCLKYMRSPPIPPGSEDFVALELYLNWRANGLPSEAPGIRR
jgi:sulfur-oxidizing protein SoxA